MSRALFVTTLLAGCYSPSVQIGAACSPNGACPEGQACYEGTCLTRPPDLDDAAVDGAVVAIDASTDAPPGPSAWSTPTLIPGVNTAAQETDPCMSPDQLTIVFARSADLFIGTRVAKGLPFVVTALTALDSPADDASPELTGNGASIYFTSDRVTAGSYDVYRSTRQGQAWSAPAVEMNLSSLTASEGDLAISPDGLTAFVARDNVLVKATRATTMNAWGAPASTGTQWGSEAAAPSINAAGDVYLHAGNPRDLFVSRKGNIYPAPSAVTELNTAATRDAAPFISADDKLIWFERDGDLYESHR